VDLRVPQGQIFGLLGPNGAGKTTLVKILLGITHLTSGAARLLGVPVGRPASRQEVGYLPESHRLPGHQTPRQFLDFTGALARVPASVRRVRAEELLAQLRMDAWARTPMKKFSKGMLQRVGIAAALMPSPRLLVLDEPTDGVDPVGRVEIRDLVLRLRQAGTTVFINSHLLSEVERISDRVAILSRGRLVTEGSVDELTVLRSEYVVQCAGDPQPFVARLTAAGFPARLESDGLHVRLTAPEDINAVIDLLRNWRVSLIAVTPRRTSLEDVFMQTLAGDPAIGAATGERA
jgi:ABC-2 type transport system ATP-binding protein